MYVCVGQMYVPPTPPPHKKPIIWISPKIFLAQFFFYIQMVTLGKVSASPFLSHFVYGCLNDCALSNRWFARHGV